MSFDASPSWSGFNYQGKVALFYALRLINARGTGGDFVRFSLMLENTEDFEIEENGQPISFHQVKAYNSSAYSKYSDALLGITLELYKQLNATGKIHTWKAINPSPECEGLIASIKNDFGIILSEYEDADPKDGNTLIEKAASTATGIPKIAAILRTAFPDNAADDLYEILCSIKSEQNDALLRLEAYQYPDGNRFCDLDEINNKIQSEISNYLAARSIAVTQERLEKTFLFFLGLMDRYIIQRHKDKQEQEKIRITFNEIVAALETDHEDIGNEYLACKFKELFAHLVDKYISEPEDYMEPEEEERCNLKEAKKLLLGLSPQNLWSYCRSFCPHIYLESDCNIDNALKVDWDGMQVVLITTLHKIDFARVSHDPSKYQFIYRTASSPHKNYLPTTIQRTKRIEREIVQNPSTNEVLFEVENMIYGGDEEYKLLTTSTMHTDAPLAEDEDPRPRREEALKHMTLVPIAAAMDALNK